MTCHGIITDRRTIHNYAPCRVPDEAVVRALEAALAAPNHRMTEPWRFTRVGMQTREELVGVARSIKEEASQNPLPEPAIEKLRAKMLNPGELIVASRVRNEDPAVEREDYAAVACAIYSMMLTLWEEGIGSKWSTGEVTRDPRAYGLLGIDVHEEEVVGFVWVGVPDGAAPKPRRRRSLDQVLRALP